MRTLPELLAGCPKPPVPPERRSPGESSRTFPGFMMHRMSVLLTRPNKAIGEFREGDYRTPLLFFLYFTIIVALSSELIFHLKIGSWRFMYPQIFPDRPRDYQMSLTRWRPISARYRL
jgi:hypothetical protein